MEYQASRKLARTVHLSIALIQLIYVYTPLHDWQYALPIVQWVTFPLLFLSGFWLVRGKKLWLWKTQREATNENAATLTIVAKKAA